MAKFHIKDDGMPGVCSAASSDSCPKTQAGDSFHGTLEEASAESQRRFEEKLGAFKTASREEEAEKARGEVFAKRFHHAAKAVMENPSEENESKLRAIRNQLTEEIRAKRGSAIINSETYEKAEIALSEFRTEQAGGEFYRHPQGKVIKVESDGTVRAFKDGKEIGTSATAEKLRAGYGAWKRADGSGFTVPAAAPKKPRANRGIPKSNPEPAAKVYSEAEVENFRTRMNGAESWRETAKYNVGELMREQKAYDAKYGAAEGRAYHYGRDGDNYYTKIDGPDPSGRSTSYTPSESQKRELEVARESYRAAVQEVEDAQTAMEKAGLGHRIPDEGNTVRVRTQEQKWLLKDHLQGQISDGYWENSGGEAWRDWSNAKVVVDPQNVGRNFSTRKDNYQLNAKGLLDVMGSEFVNGVRSRTSNPDYNEDRMRGDLADLRKVFKTTRGSIKGN